MGAMVPLGNLAPYKKGPYRVLRAQGHKLMVEVQEIHIVSSSVTMTFAGANKEAVTANASPQVRKNDIIDTKNISAPNKKTFAHRRNTRLRKWYLTAKTTVEPSSRCAGMALRRRTIHWNPPSILPNTLLSDMGTVRDGRINTGIHGDNPKLFNFIGRRS